MVKYGILVISHGSRSAEWVRLVDEAVEVVRVPDGVPIVSSYLEIVEGRLIQDGITRLESLGVSDIIVVPLFVSSGSTHIDEISYALGLKPQPALPTELKPFAIRARIHCTSPIDDDPDIAGIVYENIRSLSTDPSNEIVLLVGHGSVESGFYERWLDGLRKLALRIQAAGGFDEVDTAMLLPDQLQAKMDYWNECKPHHTVLVAPLFLSEGYFTNEVIPSRLKSYTYRYNGKSLLPHPWIARWMERQTALFWSGNDAVNRGERVIDEWPNGQD